MSKLIRFGWCPALVVVLFTLFINFPIACLYFACVLVLLIALFVCALGGNDLGKELGWWK